MATQNIVGRNHLGYYTIDYSADYNSANSTYSVYINSITVTMSSDFGYQYPCIFQGRIYYGSTNLWEVKQTDGSVSIPYGTYRATINFGRKSPLTVPDNGSRSLTLSLDYNGSDGSYLTCWYWNSSYGKYLEAFDCNNEITITLPDPPVPEYTLTYMKFNSTNVNDYSQWNTPGNPDTFTQGESVTLLNSYPDLSRHIAQGWSEYSSPAHVPFSYYRGGSTQSFSGDTILYPVYKYSVQIKDYLGSEQPLTYLSPFKDESVLVPTRQAIYPAPPPLAEGWTLIGWSKTRAPTSISPDDLIPAPAAPNTSMRCAYSYFNGNSTIYEVVKFTITYDVGDGSGDINPTTHLYNAGGRVTNQVPTPPSNHSFFKWTATIGGTTVQLGQNDTFNSSQINGPVTLTATYKSTIVNCTLTYNANGGSGGPAPFIFHAGEPFKLSATVPTYTNNGTTYTFKGWSTSNSAVEGTLYAAGESVTFNSDTQLYAVWGYTITLNGNGGTWDNGFRTELVAEYNLLQDPIRLPSTLPTRGSGYTFRYYSKSIEGTDPQYNVTDTYSKTDHFGKDTTLYAIWNAATYKITFNPNGGSGGPGSKSYSVNTEINIPSTTPERSGYTFLGWATSTSASTASYLAGSTYSAGTFNNVDTTLYAVWQVTQVDTCTLTYSANGGTNPPSAQTVNVGSQVPISSAIPSKEGFSFLGWGETPTSTQVAYSPNGVISSLTSNKTIYAIWQYTITYDPNTGSGGPASTGHIIGQSINIPTAEPTKPGFTFIGWSKSNTSTSVDYRAGQTNVSPEFFNQPTVLYAVWIVNSTPTESRQVNLLSGDHINSVSLTVNGTQVATDDTLSYSVPDGSTISMYANVDSGYELDGWYTESTKVSSKNPYIISSLASDLTLTAKAVEADKELVLVYDVYLKDIAEAIRYVKGESSTVSYKPSQMAVEIRKFKR